MNRFDNGVLIREIINGINNISNFNDFLRIKTDVINKLEIIERNIGNNKGKNNNFEDYLIKANQYISQYKPQSGFSSGYSNLFNIPNNSNEKSDNYIQEDFNYNKNNIENNNNNDNYINNNENINLKQVNFQNQNILKNNQTNNTLNYNNNSKNIYNINNNNLNNNYNISNNQNNNYNFNPNYNIQEDYQSNRKNIEIDTPIPLQSPPKKIEYTPLNLTEQTKSLFQSNNPIKINQYNNNNIINNNNFNKELYEFNNELMNENQHYNSSPLLQQYLSNNINNSEYKYKPNEKLSNNPIETMNKGNRITNIIMKINENDELNNMIKKLFSDDFIDKMMDPHCPNNYITKIEESIKQIEILQEKDKNENKVIYSYQSNNDNNNNESSKNKNLQSIPKRAQIKSKKDNLSLNLSNKNSIINNSKNSLNNNNYSKNKVKPKSYADNLLLAHGLPLGISNEENNNKSLSFQTKKKFK